MNRINRRKLFTWGLVTTAAALSGRCARNQFASNAPPSGAASVYRSQAGQLSVQLQARQQRVAVGDRTASLLAYNDQVPGPLLEANAGDTVRISFANQLEQPTNLHFHGLHIPPTGTADNVFLTVSPGEVYEYAFDIPAQHPGGLFWYHPHHHGVVASQVFGGLAGGFVVRGEVDAIPEIQAAEEAILVLQDFDLNRWGRLREPAPIFRRWGRQGNLLTTNGGLAPDLTIPPSGLLRLRLLNASASRIYQLRLENHPWHLIGLDGGTLPEPVELEDDLILAPGERADILVPGDRSPDTYSLISLPYDRGIATMMAGMADPHNGEASEVPRLVARLHYGAAAKAVPMPKTLLPAASIPEPIRRREFVLDHGIDNGQYFLINDRGFAPGRIDTVVQLNTVEDWRIVNKAGMDHPFHLHTNAFQILGRNGKPYPFQVWKDVVNIKAYESVDLRVAFTDFPGKTVYHCHILDHEDQGMMGIIDIQPAA